MKLILLTLLLAVTAVAQLDLSFEPTFTTLPAKLTTSIITNVVEGDNHFGSLQNYPTIMTADGAMNTRSFSAVTTTEGYSLFPPPYRPADLKWSITNVVRITRIEIQWGTNVITHIEETVLRSTTNQWRLITEWKEEK